PVVLRILGYGKGNNKAPSKIIRFAPAILGGFLVGSAFNRNIHQSAADINEVGRLRKTSDCLDIPHTEFNDIVPVEDQSVAGMLPISDECINDTKSEAW